MAGWWSVAIATLITGLPSFAQVIIDPPTQLVAMDTNRGRARLRITNTGSQVQSVRFRVAQVTIDAGGKRQQLSGEQFPDFAGSLDPLMVSMAPGEKQTVKVDLKPGHRLMAGRYTLSIRAESVATGGNLGSAELTAVVPVRVAVGEADINLEPASLGDRNVHATFCFPVEANIDSLSATVTVTPLFCDGVAGHETSQQMPLDTSQPVVIASSSGQAIPGGKTRATYVVEKLDASRAVALCSTPVTISGKAGEGISERMFVTVYWKKQTALMPAGNYRARVTLNIVPTGD
jgi:hypothetical protein